MKKYFIMSDSNVEDASTADGHVPDKDNFATKIMDHFGLNFECHARFGASNDQIIRRTNEWVSNQDPQDDLMVFIGWSTWEREEWFIDGEYVNVDQYSLNDIPPNALSRYNEWRVKVDNTHGYMTQKTIEWNSKIHNYIEWLYDHDIQFFMWNNYIALDRVEGLDNDIAEYIHPYNDDYTMYDYLVRVNNHHPFPDDQYHFDAAGHTIWADCLINHITENRII